jgi:hypothetical protein
LAAAISHLASIGPARGLFHFGVGGQKLRSCGMRTNFSSAANLAVRRPTGWRWRRICGLLLQFLNQRAGWSWIWSATLSETSMISSATLGL